MKRFATTIVTLIVIANVLPMNAIAGCGGGGGGGYRPSIRPYYGSTPSYQPAPSYHRQPQTIYQRPVQQQYIPQPAVRTISTRQQIASPQIRIAPSQRRIATNQQSQIRTSQPAQAQPTQQAQQSQQAQVQPTTPQTQQPAAPQPQQSNNNNNVNSALAMLAGQPATQPQATPAPQASTASTAQYVGNWTASVGNNATVQLTLQADGSFNWVANNGGKQSSFDGRFTITDGKLTLARSSDNQKLSGAMTFSGNGFNFKLNGAKDSGLNFTQQS